MKRLPKINIGPIKCERDAALCLQPVLIYDFLSDNKINADNLFPAVIAAPSCL